MLDDLLIAAARLVTLGWMLFLGKLLAWAICYPWC
jgi:hypothetical protein